MFLCITNIEANYNSNSLKMAKKYIFLESQRKKYKLYSEDIKMVFMKMIRKIPRIPEFVISFKSYEHDTE
jgi:hypothetical protein